MQSGRPVNEGLLVAETAAQRPACVQFTAALAAAAQARRADEQATPEPPGGAAQPPKVQKFTFSPVTPVTYEITPTAFQYMSYLTQVYYGDEVFIRCDLHG